MSLSSVLGLGGSYFFGPIGGFIGSTLGTLLDPADDVTNYGPRIEDRKISTTGYGAPLPKVWGVMQLAGHVIEPQNFELTETVIETEEGGKGGPTVTTVNYTYSATFAAALCEGPIIGVRRIWLDSELVYDLGDTATPESIAVSNEAAVGFRIYTGSTTQTPDGILEGINGAGNTPAYRGTAYIVFDRLQLENYGNRVPNIRVEVVATGTSADGAYFSGSETLDQDLGGHVITTIDEGVVRVWDGVESNTYAGTSGETHLYDMAGNYLGTEPTTGPRANTLDDFPIAPTGAGRGEGGVLGHYHIYPDIFIDTPANGFFIDVFESDFYDPDMDGVKDYDNQVDDLARLLDQDRFVMGIVFSADRKRMLVLQGEDNGVNTTNPTSGIWYMFDEYRDVIDTGTIDYTGTSYDERLGISNATLGGTAIVNMMESDYRHIWVVPPQGASVDAECWEIDDSNHMTVVYSTVSGYTANAVASMFADNGVMTTVGRKSTGVGYIQYYTRETILSIGGATLSDIVDDIEDEVGITSANRDNSALTDTVDGYMVARQMPARKAIEPLQTAYFFDTVESDYKLKSVKRGGASVATILSNVMGAQEFGAEPIFPLEKTRVQEIEIPIEVTCQYVSPDRGYESGVQRSRRINTQSNERVNINLPISMTDNEGKQIAEVLHFNYWAERNIYKFALMPEYTYLDPSDVITVNDGGALHTIRLVSMNLTPGGVIQCEGVADRPAVYSSTSTGADNSATPITVTNVGPTKAIYGDWPMFTNNEDDEGFYMAVSGYLPGWNGAAIYKSIDNGANYFQVTSAVDAVAMGYTTDVLPAGSLSVFDRASTVNVIMTAGTLTSSTELAVLNGANPIMIGSELIQFVNATLEADGSYTLDTLLRGRKGTDWAIGTHAIGEDAVFIDTNLRRIGATINAERQYKAVSIGKFVADATPRDFTYTGINKKPYSPTHIKGARNASADLAIAWVRRSRMEASPLWSPPLGEDSEEYEIDIYDAGFTTVKRTVTGLATPSYDYVAADQITDFGSTQASINMKIYQKSATVGRGYEGSATL